MSLSQNQNSEKSMNEKWHKEKNTFLDYTEKKTKTGKTKTEKTKMKLSLEIA